MLLISCGHSSVPQQRWTEQIQDDNSVSSPMSAGNTLTAFSNISTTDSVSSPISAGNNTLTVFSNISTTDSVLNNWHINYSAIPNMDTLLLKIDENYYQHAVDTLLWRCIDCHICVSYDNVPFIDTILCRHSFASFVPASFLIESDIYNFNIAGITNDGSLLCKLSLLQAESDYVYYFDVTITPDRQLIISEDTIAYDDD